MSNIVAFFGTAAVHIVYCGVFWDHRYRCSHLRHPTAAGHKTTAIQSFCSSKLDIAALQKPTTINISFCADTIAAVEKNTAICNLQWHLYDHRNRDSFLRVQFLSYSGRLDRRYRPSNSLPLPKSSLCFFFFLLFIFDKNTVSLYLISLYLSNSSKTQNTLFTVSLSNSSRTQNPTQTPSSNTIYLSNSLSISLSLSLNHRPKIPPSSPPSQQPHHHHQHQTLSSRHLGTPIHLVDATQHPQSTLSPPPHFIPKSQTLSL